MSQNQPPVIPDPLTESHYQQIVNNLDILDQAQRQVEKAKQAGINVADQQAQITETRAKLLQIKNVYFPGR